VSRRARVIALVIVAVAITAGAVGMTRHRTQAPAKAAAAGMVPLRPSRAELRAAKGQRMTVEVLNATHVRGLARRATLTLRDHGFDVVSTGTNREQLDSTLILDRTGHHEWASLAAKAMGGGAVLVRPDSSRDVDLTVLIGASWRPPSEPFYP
jgi:hypothetical protein